MKLLRFLGLKGSRVVTPYSLSGGKKGKVAIGSILSLDPKVYLLDEPTANLDPKTEGKLIDLIFSLWQKGETVIIATQDLIFAAHVSGDPRIHQFPLPRALQPGRSVAA